MALCRCYVHLEQLDEPINADFCAAASSRGLVLARRGDAGEPADLLVEYRAAAVPIVGGASAGSVEFTCSNPFGSSRIR
jgi:hypothetical protein